MRHGKKFNPLSRTSAHRKSMLSNMAGSLIVHRRIMTTVAKAKELRKYVEPLITRAKIDSVHNRRIAFSYLKNKDMVTELFDGVGRKVGDRPGGYTRIIKMGKRLGDAAEMCYIELVDYNSLMLEANEASNKKKTRRGRKKKASDDQPQADSVNVSGEVSSDDSTHEASNDEPTGEVSKA